LIDSEDKVSLINSLTATR